MSLPSRPVAFGRAQPQQNQFVQQQLQAQQAQQQQQNGQSTAPQSNGIALPGPSSYSLPGGYAFPSITSTSQPAYSMKPPMQSNTLPGPSSISSPPAQSVVPATPAPLSLEQQHITAVEGIIPTLQNIVATVNLDCRLDLKTIALHARNAEYNPKVSLSCILTR